MVATLAWFAVLGRPLSVRELQRLLLKTKANQRQIAAALESLGPVVRQREGLWTVRGARVRWPNRKSARWSRRKWRRLRMAVRLLRWVPYLRMIAAANTLADKTIRPDSDIDVFIVTAHGRMYLARTLVTGVLQFFGLRRHGRKVRDRICLSFFVTDGALDLSPIAFEPYDIYLAFWVAELEPVLDAGGTHQKFLEANRWAGNFIPYYHEGIPRTVGATRAARFWERVFDSRLGDRLEQRLAAWQQARIRGNQDRNDPDVLLVATDRMLKFHEKERRKVYRTEWEQLMRKTGYPIRPIQQ